jgi:hypothetical protein
MVVVLSTPLTVVVGDGSGSSRGHSAQTPIARPTTTKPAISRRIIEIRTYAFGHPA